MISSVLSSEAITLGTPSMTGVQNLWGKGAALVADGKEGASR